MNERFILKGRLSDAKARLKQCNLKAENYIILIRDIIDPVCSDFTTLDLERAKITLDDFIALQNQAKELKDQIIKLEEALNG
jgi:N-acetylglucosamine-6-phosphate deacetylase